MYFICSVEVNWNFTSFQNIWILDHRRKVAAETIVKAQHQLLAVPATLAELLSKFPNRK